jgi:hypothetical protein
MNEVCVENCAIKRDCSAFEPKPNLKLGDMPRFPNTENMTREEKFASVTVYLAKVVDHLQGVEDDYRYSIGRSNSHGTGSSPLPENFRDQDLLLSVHQGNTASEDREKRPDSSNRSSEMDGKTG